MDGILNVLKPPGMTSFDVVSYLRGMLKIKKIGHAGTLDPGAAGVLPVCIGRATKSIEYLMDKDKSYRVELTLGISTDTQDAEGQVVERHHVNLTEQQIVEGISHFTGKIKQVPPMYSAVRVKGKRLYELARAGVTVEREAREVEIYSIRILNIFDNNTKVLFDVMCSKGTYVRTLCADIGKKLGCGAHMSFLIRTKAGAFDICDALTLEDINGLLAHGKLDAKLVKVEELFKNLKKVELNDFSAKRFLNGMIVKLDCLDVKPCEILAVYNNSKEFFALGEVVLKQNQPMLILKKVF
ncbi:MAG TPA: tRNA pseudouridine(55) synthase TruB [Clostridiaceae bacterium]|nr:tRNA pseudouridine(55) synthase TruB [Clostridiaceae bacterium]